MTDFANTEAYQTVLPYRSRDASPETALRNREIILTALDAMAEGDGGPFVDLFDPDVVFYEAPGLPYGGTHRGLEATKKALSGIHETYDRTYEEIEEVAAAGDLVMLYAVVDYRVRKNGRSGTLQTLELFRFRDGKVIEWRGHYLDAASVVEDTTADA